MLDAPMVHYDPRPATSAPLQRPMMAPHFMMGSPYATPPMATLPGPPYQPPVSMGFGSYHTPPPEAGPGVGRPTLRVNPPSPRPSLSRRRGRRSLPARSERSRSSSVQSDALSSAKPTAAHKTVTSKTVTPILAQGSKLVEFASEVDQLMKAIQAKPETEMLVKKAEAESKQERAGEQQGHESQQEDGGRSPLSVSQERESEGNGRTKKFRCAFPGCDQSFVQKTHLTIHYRSHTGEKPFYCKVCNHTFSQHGNLKTHERRHTGEKPYTCETCGKRFAQRGNVRAHERTHLHVKDFLCVLEGCSKAFTQRGNLKTHQNKFHAKALADLALKFQSIDVNNVSSEDREMWEYFATLYKNSNKGIKGRGKNRKVGLAPGPSPISPHPAFSTHFAVHSPPMPHTLPHPPHSVHNLPLPGPYTTMHRPPPPPPPPQPGMMMHMPHRVPRGTYDMYEDGVYEDEHGRAELAFGDRMY